MWRYLAGGLAALLLAGAGIFWFTGRAKQTAAPLLAAAPAATSAAKTADDPLPQSVPEATDRTREQKRFDRYDKDRDGKVTREEWLMQRRKAFAKLDTNHDGQLSFDEWAAKTEAKFATADADRSGTLTPTEFVATAAKRSAHPRKCPPATAAAPATRDEDG